MTISRLTLIFDHVTLIQMGNILSLGASTVPSLATLKQILSGQHMEINRVNYFLGASTLSSLANFKQSGQKALS